METKIEKEKKRRERKNKKKWLLKLLLSPHAAVKERPCQDNSYSTKEGPH
jgi:hypothetical protein